MHVVYTGERVRLRPFKSEDEFAWLLGETMAIPNDHWGPGWWPEAARNKDFAQAGMLDPGKYSSFAVERLDTGECIGFVRECSWVVFCRWVFQPSHLPCTGGAGRLLLSVRQGSIAFSHSCFRDWRERP